ncbi:uncharacterized protein METZ01_LOCUS250093 [marine metagenome]|uniref:Uncharacterized protein n=1 Tax=marine metagenome TaxID=408172 RepID=A0A382ID72_9ZZZZ
MATGLLKLWLDVGSLIYQKCTL